MCKTIIVKFIAEIVVEVGILTGKIIHLVFYRLAYKQARNKF
jgi:hypothetical protein